MFEILFKIIAKTPLYEEGSWTPIIGGTDATSGQTYTAQEGRYIKVGTTIYVWGHATLAVKGTLTGAVRINGLPFASVSTPNLYGGAAVSFFNGLATNWISLGGVINPATSSITLYGRQSAGTGSTALATADIGNTSSLTFNAIYNTSE